ncbi:dephospho-CoA kinase [Micromonospora sp. CPCC 206061]|uniref:dephospho-CoA kinase n=1 Tax=Micromonospora sp. CPCC 206061 TaxID=3122410 RepID=UPI003FA5FB48
MLTIGLTGGIGAGKSAVASRLAARGALLVDSDRLAREVVAAGTPGLAAVVAAFGDGVLGPDGELDRPALGTRVFGDEAARRRLEAIVHPRVRERSVELTAAAPPDAIVLNDVPLLAEVGLAPAYHLVIVVEADEATRVERLVRDRGMPAPQARARIAAQAGDADRRAVADVLLRNDATLDDLAARVDALWDDRLVPYEENVRRGRVAEPGALVRPEDWPRVAARLGHVLGGEPRLADNGVIEVHGFGAGGAWTERRADETGARRAGRQSSGDELGLAGFPRLADGRHGSADPGRPATIVLI